MEHYTEFLPISRADMEARGWDQLDFVVVGGDAYVAVSYTHLDVYKRQDPWRPWRSRRCNRRT